MNKRSFILVGAGLVAGSIAGYLYYHYVGCISGTCSITSDPVNSTLYGSVTGALFFSLFDNSKEKKTIH